MVLYLTIGFPACHTHPHSPTHTHTCTHTQIHRYTYTYTYAQTNTHLHLHTYVHTQTHEHTQTHTRNLHTQARTFAQSTYTHKIIHTMIGETGSQSDQPTGKQNKGDKYLGLFTCI